MKCRCSVFSASAKPQFSSAALIALKSATSSIESTPPKGEKDELNASIVPGSPEKEIELKNLNEDWKCQGPKPPRMQQIVEQMQEKRRQ